MVLLVTWLFLWPGICTSSFRFLCVSDSDGHWCSWILLLCLICLPVELYFTWSSSGKCKFALQYDTICSNHDQPQKTMCMALLKYFSYVCLSFSFSFVVFLWCYFTKLWLLGPYHRHFTQLCLFELLNFVI